MALSLPVSAVELQGHRGARGLWPEHTRIGFLGALKLGVDVLELDVGLSADGVPVVHHDPRLSPELARVPGGQWVDDPGPILRELTWARLRDYDIGRPRPGGKVARRFPAQKAADGQKLLRLADVFTLVDALGPSGQDVHFNIELKLAPEPAAWFAEPTEFARAVVEAVRRAGMTTRVTIQGFDWRALRSVRELEFSITLVALTVEQRWLDTVRRGKDGPSPWTAGLDVDDFGGAVPRLVQALGATIWSPYFRDITSTDVELAHELGLRVSVWTVNEVPDMERMLELGVDGIITDYPDRAREVMAARGLPLPPGRPAR